MRSGDRLGDQPWYLRLGLLPVGVVFISVVFIGGASCASFGSTTPTELNPMQADIATRQARMAVALAQVPTETPTSTAQTGLVLVPTATPLPTATPIPTATALPEPTPQPSHQPMQPAVRLTGLTHAWQTWNNCGPATLAMNLSYFGSTLDQAAIGAVLRRHPDDKNVSPEELAAFATAQGYHAQVRVNGSAELMHLLLSNGIPVLIETWLEEDPNDGMGHYRLLVGYDDADQAWIGYDSYVDTGLFSSIGPYRGIRMAYAETDALWKVFNRTYLLIYTDAQAAAVASIYGESLDQTVMWQQATQAAQGVVQQTPDDPFAWFNLGTNLTARGDYTNAAQAFDQARRLGLPWRMLWYQYGPFQAYDAIGRAQDVLTLTDATLSTTQSIEELHYWRGRALAALGNPAEAQRAWQQALTLNPDYQPARAALASAQ
ncbi:MAG: tetratricopeptide repeat protein [Caldilineaceae bacterium]|nr:tetratricopeptide repeat protein [Caldilineaceae bacterium]